MTGRPGTRLGTLALLAPLLLTGCFGYVPVELSELSVDDRVRARLEAGEGERLRETLSLGSATLSGRVLERRPDTLLLSVPVAGTVGGRVGGAPLSQHVAIPGPAIRQLELRVLRRGRTVGLALGAAALMGYILYEAFDRSDPRGLDGENPPPVDEALRPALRPIRLHSF